MAAKFDNKLM